MGLWQTGGQKNKDTKMKKLMLALFGMLGIVSVMVIGAGTYSPTTFYNDVSVGSFTGITNIVGVVTNSSNGIMTNGSWSVYYRFNGTNGRGRLPLSIVTNMSFTGAISNNTILLCWKYKDGVDKQVIERSENGTDFSNWVTVASTQTNYFDYGTNAWTNSFFTNIFQTLIPTPSVPWIDTNTVNTIVATHTQMTTEAHGGIVARSETGGMGVAYAALAGYAAISGSASGVVSGITMTNISLAGTAPTINGTSMVFGSTINLTNDATAGDDNVLMMSASGSETNIYVAQKADITGGVSTALNVHTGLTGSAVHSWAEVDTFQTVMNRGQTSTNRFAILGNVVLTNLSSGEGILIAPTNGDASITLGYATADGTSWDLDKPLINMYHTNVVTISSGMQDGSALSFIAGGVAALNMWKGYSDFLLCRLTNVSSIAAITGLFQNVTINGGAYAYSYNGMWDGDISYLLRNSSNGKHVWCGASLAQPWLSLTNAAGTIILGTGKSAASSTNAFKLTAGACAMQIGDTGPVMLRMGNGTNFLWYLSNTNYVAMWSDRAGWYVQCCSNASLSAVTTNAFTW